MKEKLLAAHRAGINHVLIPKDNEKDLVDYQKVKEDIKITPVSVVDDVLKLALTKELKRVEWVEVDNLSKAKDNLKKFSQTEDNYNLHCNFIDVKIADYFGRLAQLVEHLVYTEGVKFESFTAHQNNGGVAQFG